MKTAVHLRKRRGRQRQSRIIIDGVRELTRAVEGGVSFDEIFLCEELLSPETQQLIEQLELPKERVYPVTPKVYERIAFGSRNDGVVATALPPVRTLDQLEVGNAPLVVVVEGVEKPGNLGAIVRTADGAGASAVIAADCEVEVFNPNAIRSSLGTVFTLPTVAASTADTLQWLSECEWPIYAALVDATESYTEADYQKGAVLVLGSEATGLSTDWKHEKIKPVAIPMLGKVDSLNVSVATAVMLYEARRQCGLPESS